MYVPAGTCLIAAPPSGMLLKLTADHIWLKGEGAGLSILKLTGAAALSSELDIVALTGAGQGVEGITFANAASLSGSSFLTWVAIRPGALGSTVRDCEFAGGYGGNTAGGSAIASYAPLGSPSQVQTSMDPVISPGVHEITPVAGTGMAGIYVGKRLIIGGHLEQGHREEVIVTARTPTSFTARFALSHASGDAIADLAENTQQLLIESNYIHDCLRCSAIVLNSGGAVVRANRIVNIGLNNFQHGIYVQSGNNRIVDNWIEGVSGYGIHGHKAVPQEDSSGDVYDGNTIVNYARQCIIVDSIPSDGANPEVEQGVSLDRYVTITNNTCRLLKGAGAANINQGIGVQVGRPGSPNTGGVLISGNTLEDACGTTPSCAWISTGRYSGASIIGNHLRMLNGGAPGQTGINSNGGSEVSLTGNIIENWNSAGAALYLASNTTATGNIVSGASGGAPMVALNGSKIVFCNNTVLQPGAAGIAAQGPSADVRICNNNLTGPPGSVVLDLASIQSGTIYENSIAGGYVKAPVDGAAPGVQIYNNQGELRWSSVPPSNSVVMTRGMGRLIRLPAGTNPVTAGLAVTFDSSGNVVTALPGSAVFQGIAIQDKTAAAGSVYIVEQSSAEFDGAQTDGPWIAGHFGIPSAVEAGKFHDQGAAPPPSNYSYVQFLDSGPRPGSAKVLLIR